MRTVLITGGTGLVGQEITKQLTEKGHRVHILTRSPEETSNLLVQQFHWDIKQQTIDTDCFDKVTDVIHLAGASIAERWTDEYKKVIIDSRVESANLLLKAMEEAEMTISTFVGASASGIYKPNTGKILNEQAEYADNFLGEVCKAWEEANQNFSNVAHNVAINRIGIVLAKDGGALEKMETPINFGFAPYFGTGEQIYSCIHVKDVARQFIYALENNLNGTFNCSVDSVSQKELNEAIAQAKGKKAITIPLPKFAIRAPLGEMSIILTDSVHMNNQKIISEGFLPEFTTVQAALNEIYSKP